jgi:NDP-sugar pyrophosphorylase family protein
MINAIILAGGKGTRLRPLTFDIPKPLVKVNGKPLIEYALEELERNGVENVYISIGYKAEKIMHYLDHRKKFGANIEYVLESRPLGTGGALRHAMEKMQRYEDVISVNGDTIFKVEFDKMYEFHKKNKALITMGSFRLDDIRGFGVIETEGSRISRFIEKPDPKEVKSNMINAGIYIISKRVLDKFPREEIFSLEKDFIEKIYKEEIIQHFPIERFITVNDIEQYKKANEEVRRLAGGEI